MEQLLPIIAERMLAISIGGLSVYLSYRLFYAVKATGEGQAQVKLPGDVTVMLSRIGPGIFFALFGASMVGASFLYPVRYTEFAADKPTHTVGTPRIEVSGIESEPRQSSRDERLRLRHGIAFLNDLPNRLDPSLAAAKRQEVEHELVDAKLALMKFVWSADWGSYEEFRVWAEGGTPAKDTKEFHAAEEFYEYGKGRSQ
jgi:hypothetical protein